MEHVTYCDKNVLQLFTLRGCINGHCNPLCLCALKDINMYSYIIQNVLQLLKKYVYHMI